MDQDDCSRLAINGVYYINRNFINGLWSDSFSIQLTANTYYDIEYDGYNGPAAFSVYLYWSSPSISKVAIPSSAFVVPEIIGSSPIQVTVVCPTGYTGDDASSPYACKEIWGDGLRVGVEVWDDANTITTLCPIHFDFVLITLIFSNSIWTCLKYVYHINKVSSIFILILFKKFKEI